LKKIFFLKLTFKNNIQAEKYLKALKDCWSIKEISKNALTNEYVIEIKITEKTKRELFLIFKNNNIFYEEIKENEVSLMASVE